MTILNNPLFQALFNTPVPRIILKADVPNFTIIRYNDAYKVATNTQERDVTGKTLWEAFKPENAGGNGYSVLMNALLQAIQNNQVVNTLPFQYDIPSADAGKTETSWWQLEIVPVMEAGAQRAACLLLTTYNITKQQVSQQTIEAGLLREQDLNEELASANEELTASNEELTQSQAALQALNNELEQRVIRRTKALAESETRFRNLVQHAPIGIAIYEGPDFVIELANEKMLEIWRKTAAEVIGKPLLTGRPEIADHSYLQILGEVYTTGQAHYGYEIKGPVVQDNQLTEIYFDVIYQPLKDDMGGITGLIAVVTDVTDRVNARLSIAESENRFQNLVQQAPIGIAIYSGPEMIIELANEKILEIWGRTAAVLDKPLLTGRPELAGHPYVDVIQEVYTSGQAHNAYEIKGGVLKDGALKEGYFDVIYQPLKDNHNGVIGLIAVITDVTERVEARKAIEHAEEMLRLAIEAAELGTWYIDVATREFLPSPRLKEFFGFYPDETMPFEVAVNQIADAYREKVITAVEATITKGEAYDMEYPIVGYHGQQQRWVKANGRRYTAEPGKPAHFSGTMVDITERKQYDQRKNDFISMVSHELKTPLTSLKAYIQLLQAIAKRDKDSFRINTLDKAEMQMNKMHKMINGFLSVAALESGKMQLVKELFNLDDAIQEMVDDAIVSHPRFLFTFLSCEPLPVIADKDKIGQVITNLLSNAVKYSPDGGEITINCLRIENKIQVSIKDNGIGIHKEDLPNLFERFYRVQSDAMKSFSGFGIGLYLCAEIIGRHHGEIWAESEEGQGSTFYFSLPMEEN